MARVLCVLAAWVAAGGLSGWALGRWLRKRDRPDIEPRRKEEVPEPPDDDA